MARHCWALATAARKEKGWFYPCFIMKNAVATSEAPKVETATSAVDTRKREEEARRAAKGGKTGGRWLATKGRGVQHHQCDRLGGKAAGQRLASGVAGGGRWGPSVGAGRPAARNPLRLGARAGRCGGSAAWGPRPALPNGVTLRVLHLTRCGRLWMARKRLLLLLNGGQVGRRSRRC